MRRNLIKVTDEIKEGGRNEDTEDFFSSIPFRIQSGGGCVCVKKLRNRGGKNSNQFLFSS